MLQFPRFNYNSTTVTLYATNLYSGSCADLDNTAPVSKLDGYTEIIDLTSYLGITLDFKFDSSGTTDNLTINLYRSTIGVFSGSELSLRTYSVGAATHGGAEKIYSLVLSGDLAGPGYYRYSMQSSGGSDTFGMIVTGRYWTKNIDED